MKTIKVSEATGPALDWLVAKCEYGDEVFVHLRDFLKMSCKKGRPVPAINDPDGDQFAVYLEYSTDWSQGGPIIERERICVSYNINHADDPPRLRRPGNSSHCGLRAAHHAPGWPAPRVTHALRPTDGRPLTC